MSSNNAKLYLYTCNEGRFKVELLKEKAFTSLAVKIRLLEPITIRGVTYPVGSVLSVGHWQVKPLMYEQKEEGSQ